MTLEEQVERQHGIVTAHIAAENAHDWNAASEGFTQAGTAFRDMLLVATAFKGVSGVRAFYDTIGKALPDFHIEIRSQNDLPGCTVCEGELTGTHLGEYMGIQPRANPIRIDITTYYFFDEKTEKLVAQRMYFDQANLLRQMQGARGRRPPKKPKKKPSHRRRTGTLA
jgi:predicted ester cyclase